MNKDWPEWLVLTAAFFLVMGFVILTGLLLSTAVTR